MARTKIKLGRSSKSLLNSYATSEYLDPYEIVFASDTKEIGVVGTDKTITWSGALDYTNIADNLRTASSSAKGLMSASDKVYLDSLIDIFENDEDSYVDTLTEILEIFKNYPESTSIINLINSKVAANPNITAINGAVKINYDAKGLVTGSTTLAVGDIPSLPGTKITSGKISSSYLNVGVTSSDVAAGNHSHTITDLNGPEGGTAGNIVVLGSGGIVTTVGGSTYLTPAQGNSAYLGISAKATDSSKLNNQLPSYYLNRANHTGSMPVDKIITSGWGVGNNYLLATGDNGSGVTYLAPGTYVKPASPALTGTPTAPTATRTTNTNQIATTKFVWDVISVIDGGDI